MTEPPVSPKSISFPIKDQSDLTLVLIKAVDQGFLQGATTVDQSLVKTIISELGSNIIKYAKRGTLTLRRAEFGGAVDIHVEATDHGPGISDIELAMTDRFSTGTSLGLGLPGVKRMSDDFMVRSSSAEGTHVWVRKRIRRQDRLYSSMDRLSKVISDKYGAHLAHDAELIKTKTTAKYDVASYVRPVPSELVSGDIATIVETDRYVLLSLVDVSGHGPRANALALEIDSFIRAHAEIGVVPLLTRLHDKLRGSIGAAVALLLVDLSTGKAGFSAVGNAGAARVIGEPWRPISKDGVLGNRLPTLTEQWVSLKNSDVILLWTDGVSELAARTYAAKNANRSVTHLARDLVIELGRPFDDSSCIVFRWIA